MRAVPALLFAVASACGDDGGATLDAPVTPDAPVDAARDAAPDAPTPVTVTATATYQYYTTTGVVDRMPDDTMFELYDSAQQIKSATLVAGAMTITGVTPPYTLCRVEGTQRNCFVSSATQVDLGGDLLRRPDLQIGTTGTVLNLDATNVAANAAPGAVIELQVENHSLEFTENVTANATAHTFAPFGESNALITASSGDVLRVTQLAPHTTAGITYRSALRQVELPAITMIQGGVTAATAILPTTDLAQTTTAFNLPRTQFDTYRTAAHPDATPILTLFTGSAPPPKFRSNGFPYLFTGEQGTGAMTDVALSFDYGNPYAVTRTPMLDLSILFQLIVMAPGATTAATLTASFYVNRPLATTTDLVPAVSPVRALLVNGMPATTALTGIGLTPTLSWTAPALGTPGSYIVMVYRYTNVNGSSRRTTLGRIETHGTSVTIPTGMVTAVGGYVFKVRAVLAPGRAEFATTPFAEFCPQKCDITDALTSLLLP